MASARFEQSHRGRGSRRARGTGAAPDAGAAPRGGAAPLGDAHAERLFFGDLHAHAFDRFAGRPAPEPLAPHGFGSYDEAYAYARDVAGLDFLALATFPSPDPQHWPRYVALTREYHQPGRFVPLPAVELADRTAGHRVVVFPGDGAPDLQRGTLPELWQALEGTGAIAIPHHPNASSEGGAQSWDVQDWSKHHPGYQPVVELVQTRGAFEQDAPDVDADLPGATAIGGRGASVQDALALGHRLGFVGGTDNHYAQPGSTRCPKGGVDFRDRVTGGLTAVFAPALTSEAVLARAPGAAVLRHHRRAHDPGLPCGGSPDGRGARDGRGPRPDHGECGR